MPFDLASGSGEQNLRDRCSSLFYSLVVYLETNETDANRKKGNENEGNNSTDGDKDRYNVSTTPNDICHLHWNFPVNHFKIRSEPIDYSSAWIRFKEGEWRMHCLLYQEAVHLH